MARAEGSAQAASRPRIGCAGWSLAASVASRFPAHGSHLERYAQVFSCVEINSSFYRSHRPDTYVRWAASVPDDFRFSVKLPRAITHEARLAGVEPALQSFLNEIAGLGDKLGYLLVQLPPSLALDVALATRCFAALRAQSPAALAVEPRHASWFTTEAVALLQHAGVTRVQAHPAAVTEAVSMPEPPAYIRLHGAPRMYYSPYEPAFIEAVGRRMQEALTRHAEVWCIFDNTAAGEAVPNALALMAALAQGR